MSSSACHFCCFMGPSTPPRVRKKRYAESVRSGTSTTPSRYKSQSKQLQKSRSQSSKSDLNKKKSRKSSSRNGRAAETNLAFEEELGSDTANQLHYPVHASSQAAGQPTANGTNAALHPKQITDEPCPAPRDLSEINPEMEGSLESLVARLETVTAKLENVVDRSSVGSDTSAAETEALAAFVIAFDDVRNDSFAQYLELSRKIGGEVAEQATLVEAGVKAQRDFLIKLSKAKEPPQNVLLELLKPTSDQIQATQAIREQHRGSKLFNHLSAISEAVPALGWVTVSPTPGPYVKEMADAGQFYTNRVIKEFKEQDKVHVDWSRAWNAWLTELQAYIKQHHTTGISWNKQGVDASSIGKGPSARGPAVCPPPPPPASFAPPPPPPGPPPPMESSGGDDQGDASRSALFASINKGNAITQGLKKVTDDMKTHKNTALRYQTPQPYKPKVSPKPFKAFNPAPKKEFVKPPKLELEGKKWIVEYQEGNDKVIIDDTNQKQTVYVFKCTKSTIQVKGKVNSITLDGCKKTALVFDDVIASVDFVNCQSVQAQVTGKVPTISIDKTDGCMVYLSKDSLSSNIVTAKSSEMNVLIPGEDGDYKEYPVPEQFKTTWNGKKLVTATTDI